MGLDSGRPFPKKLLWLRGGKRGKVCAEKYQRQWEWGSEGTEGPRKGFPGPFCLPVCGLQTSRKITYTAVLLLIS